MSRAVAIQMDPIEGIDINADSSFALALEAQKRGHALYHYLPRHLVLREGRVYAHMRPLQVRREKGNHATLGGWETLDLRALDIVLMRQDPPFDMSYITATHLLEHVHPATLVVNDPIEVRNAPEKLFVTHFPELMPPTLITSDRREVIAFREAHKDIIVKPLYGNGGSGVFHIAPGDEPGALLRCSRCSIASRSSCAICRRFGRATSASSWSTASRPARSTAFRRQARRVRTCMPAASR
jgi:glutathione synthase